MNGETRIPSLSAGNAVPVVQLRDLNREPLRRVASFDASAVETESRLLEFSFSSEAPVARWFGDEVLSHAAESVDLTRLNDGAPLLWNHNPDQVLGVVERGWIDEEKKRGMVSVRFSRSAFAEEKLADIRDGILRNVSVGYSISDADQSRDGSIVATSWQPHEVSVVSVPADTSVGIGRQLETTPAAPAADQPQSPIDPMEPTIDIEAVKAQAAADERSRVASITGLCREHKADDLAQGLIERGATETEAMKDVLAAIGKRAKQPATPAAAAQPIAGASADIGLSEKEARSYSFLKAIRAQAFPNDPAAFEAAAFEREVSAATSQRMGGDARGYLVPHDVLKRDLTVGTATAAGDLVFTDARPGSFIELLRNRLALATLGVQTLTGLVGPVAIPKQTGGATAYWVAEKGEPTESNPTVGQVNLNAKTLGAFTEFSRRLILQSSIDVESMVRRELATVMALEIDRAALYGTGTSSQPKGLKFVTGINTVDFAANAPTYAEVVSMETAINADNADIGAMSYLTNSTIYGGFKTTEKASSTAQFILEPGGTVNGYNVVRSNQVESNDVFFGVWNQILMGMWGALDLQVNPYALDKSGGVRVTAFQDVDVAVRYAESFARGNNTL
jgi:HK97 family phage major capsid protein/HK97 family phage prohead protease